MKTIQPNYITDKDGNKISVIIPIAEYKKIMEMLSDLEDINLYDEAKKSKEPSTPFDEYVIRRKVK